MSDDQGDAEFEASLAGIEQAPAPRADAGAGGGTAELRDLRATVEELARRMGAGFREDLAQIRAIAASVAERDLTDDVRALRAEVAALAGRDSAQPLLDELASLRSQLQGLAAGDDVRGLRGELAPVQATLDRLAARLDDDSGRSQVLARFQALEAKLDALAGDDRGSAVTARLDELAASIEQRLAGLATADQVGRIAGDLRAQLADAIGSLDGEAVTAELATLRAQLGAGRGTVVEQLQDHLADVASGEVVGALWDEVRAVRAAVERDGATREAPGAGTAEVLESIATLRSEVEGIGAAVAATAEPVADPAVVAVREELQTITGEMATLRTELAEGLVVEPSDALSASLDALRAELDGLRATLADLPSRTEPVEVAAPAAPAGPPAELVALLHDELAAVRSGVDEVRGRLEEGVVLEHEVPVGEGPAADVEVLADQIAALRDLVANEMDGLRQAVVADRDRQDQAAAEVPVAPTGPVSASLDEGTLELLRDEIRAAGAIGDQVIDALREELKALRRRIAVKAQERVLDDDQLAQIAEAVAARLDRD